LVERLLCKQEVIGSIPFTSTMPEASVLRAGGRGGVKDDWGTQRLERRVGIDALRGYRRGVSFRLFVIVDMCEPRACEGRGFWCLASRVFGSWAPGRGSMVFYRNEVSSKEVRLLEQCGACPCVRR